MDTYVARTARSAADALAIEFDEPRLVDEVEASLYARASAQRPGDYLDPIALGSLIVSVANLAWVIYMDRKKVAKPVTPKEIVDTVKMELPETEGLDPARRDKIINIVIDHTIQNDDEQEPRI
jgi:hypothetical protein